MKKIFIITIVVAVLAALICTVALAAVQPDPKVMPYYGEGWYFDIEEKEYPYITVIPQDRQEPQVYGNGYVGKVEPEEKKYDIILLGQ